MPVKRSNAVKVQVRGFYEDLPFNYESRTSEQAAVIRGVDQISIYPPLARSLSAFSGSTLLDAGCGVGWLASTAAYWYGASCLGIDFCARAIERARAVASDLGISGKVEFCREDIFALSQEIRQRRFDVVSSLGVLHHTNDCFRGLSELAALIKPNGYLLLGLYHRYGRKPLLEEFAQFRSRFFQADCVQERMEIQRCAISRWNELFRRNSEVTFNESWFRDQCLHPHETQWTLKEVAGWFKNLGIIPLSTSLDRFSADPDWERLFDTEKDQERVARKRLFEDKQFFPGFFVVWGQKK